MIQHAYRLPHCLCLPVAVSTGDHARYDYPVQAEINFTQVFRSLGWIQPFDDNLLRVEETDAAGNIIEPSMALQFERDPAYDAYTNAKGTLLFLLRGVTPAHTTRHFAITLGENAVARGTAVVQVQLSMAQDEGQECFQIETLNSTYLYQIRAAGLSSLLDKEGNDWISFHPWGGSDGKYRGIPNLGVPEGGFHPGFFNCRSVVLSQGPIRVRIFSETNDHLWAGMWDFYPTFARLTVLQVAAPYWFLYEGTPGGRLDLEGGYIVRSDGRRTPLAERWDELLPRPRWLYFGSSETERVIYFVHHENDEVMDSFWPMQGDMTVFGFGRLHLNRYLTQTPARFTIGLAESGDYAKAASVIYSATQPLGITVGKPEAI